MTDVRGRTASGEPRPRAGAGDGDVGVEDEARGVRAGAREPDHDVKGVRTDWTGDEGVEPRNPFDYGESVDPAYLSTRRIAEDQRTWVTWDEYSGDDAVEFLKGRRWS